MAGHCVRFCIGLAEKTNTSVIWWGIGFVISIFIPSIHLSFIYILLFLAMPVHPDDRQYLLRFKIARWWHRIRNKKAMTA
jgi:hypothetical protein